jgi:hypothetical protein
VDWLVEANVSEKRAVSILRAIQHFFWANVMSNGPARKELCYFPHL